MRKIQLNHCFPRKIFILLNVLFFCTLVSSANAALISVSVSNTTVNIGDTIDVDFRISGLSSLAGDSLSAFDFDVLFDESVFAFTSFGFSDSVYGNQLDLAEPGAFPFDGDVFDMGGGRLDAYGLSGNSEGFLDTNQVDEFSFLRLSYTAIAASSASLISLDLLDPNLFMLDSSFLDLTVDFAPSFVSMTVLDTANVPEPETLSLMLICLAFVWGRSQKRRRL